MTRRSRKRPYSVEIPDDLPPQMLALCGNDLELTGTVWDDILIEAPAHASDDQIRGLCGGCRNPIYHMVIQGIVAVEFVRIGDTYVVQRVRLAEEADRR